MTPPPTAAEVAGAAALLPPLLRRLLDDELAAGNAVAGIGHTFPAAPVGVWLRLAQPVSTRPRASGEEIRFVERRMQDYNGEFTDAARHSFLLEPPVPPDEPPDMDAIRAAHAYPGNSRAAADAKVTNRTSATPLLERFRTSMIGSYEMWHDGIGYDVDAIADASPAERAAIETLMLGQSTIGWREVEALAALDTPRARERLRSAAQSRDGEVRAAVRRCATSLFTAEEMVSGLVRDLDRAKPFEGLSATLDAVEQMHPAPVIDALMNGTLSRGGDVACLYAAMLLYLHGRAASACDWELRPFWLRFNTEDRGERVAVFRELCDRLGIDAALYIGRSSTE